jgi:hypothetical protein
MANNYEAVGKLYRVYDTQQVKDTFRKREFVLEMQDGNYPQHIKFQLTQDRCDLLDRFQIGQEVTVFFNLRGRPFTNREGQEVFYTNIEAWRMQAGAPSSTAPAQTDYSQITPPPSSASTTTFDDVPF